MNLAKRITALIMCVSIGVLSIVSISVQETYGQDARAALQRGYRTGYSDGYMAGYRDAIDNESKNIARHREYVTADRAFSRDFGSLDDYRDGYRQGFESGYETGYEKRSFESTVPSTLGKRGLKNITFSDTASESKVLPQAQDNVRASDSGNVDANTAPSRIADTTAAQTPAKPMPAIKTVSYVAGDGPIIIIPRDTELILELQEEINTEQSRVGEKFTARVVSPVEIEGAVIEGRVERITKPGRIKRRAELLLSFDRIVISEERWSNFSAIVTEVMAVKGDNIRTVNSEGTAIGQRTIKEDGLKIGATTGAGAGIGALTAGPVGAAVGAGIGAAFGVGAVIVERGKHIRLNENQQLRIRTSYETKIR